MKRSIPWLSLTAAILLTIGGSLALGQAAPGGGGAGRGGRGGGGGLFGGGAAAPVFVPVPGVIPYVTEARSEITSLPTPPLTPKNAIDLRNIQARVEAVQKYAMPATVGIIMSDGQGSGVIVSKDGYVLTAGHVSGAAGARVGIVLSNGQRVVAVSLGANNQIDSGMIKIITPGDYPFVPMGSDAKLTAGQWVVAMGHPGGYQQGRPPVVRLGRILSVRSGDRGFVGTDCPLINGDSGGPLFDLDGRVIGINSRIGATTTTNIHVPVDTFLTTWDRLAKSEVWGGAVFTRGPAPSGGVMPNDVAPHPRLGLTLKEDTKGLIVTLVSAGTGAENAGLKENDIVIRVDGQSVKSVDELSNLIAKHKIGDTVTVDILRSAEPKRVSVKLGENP